MFLDTLPKDLLLLLFVAFFASVHAGYDEAVPKQEGIRSVLASGGLAFLLGWNLFTLETTSKWSVAAVISLCSLLAFLGTGVQLAVVKFGTRILSKPEPLLRAILPPMLANILFPPSDDKDTSAQTPKES